MPSVTRTDILFFFFLVECEVRGFRQGSYRRGGRCCRVVCSVDGDRDADENHWGSFDARRPLEVWDRGRALGLSILTDGSRTECAVVTRALEMADRRRRVLGRVAI